MLYCTVTLEQKAASESLWWYAVKNEYSCLKSFSITKPRHSVYCILQIANVGLNNVDAQALSNAVAGDTLFIHGKSVEGGSRDIRDDADIDIEEAIEPDVSCEATCGTEHEESSGMSTVCDPSCETDNRFAGYLCGAGDPLRFGSSCRTCYTDQEAALVAEGELRLEDPFTSEARHVIMCDTRRPPEAMECSAKCTLKTDTVCNAESIFLTLAMVVSIMGMDRKSRRAILNQRRRQVWITTHSIPTFCTLYPNALYCSTYVVNSVPLVREPLYVNLDDVQLGSREDLQSSLLYAMHELTCLNYLLHRKTD